ncbi:putative aminotransferase [Trypanosoma cruzi]|uniref:cysteine desulfurase n=2 Tax=Trypanosoma cruzi TaxID=5693 RepID=Q4DVR1_TRYCC|nr:cysteine desulfurase, putative [Trypanosoma cruzi]EAN96609.1 cysteine desulfurase, putative [Trypanosoma cruzi]PWV10179.1 putative aminotransferase [Trypanosoma cruzi]RNC49929.1 putative cysteine desulfurase [Trypanosoma cruzi]|eukprot:XP_818460.1 cysteine desulfurase [Trypanosoma cruzi strain CL Brener]
MCNVEGLPLRQGKPRPLPSTDPLPIYLDYNATTPLCDEAWEAMVSVRSSWGNPSSSHPYGLAAKFALEEARRKISDAIHAETPESIVFTSGGTEANNLAIIGGTSAVHERDPTRFRVIATTVEHPAVEEVVKFLQLSNPLQKEESGLVTHRFPVDVTTGCVNPDQWRQLLLQLPGGPRSVALVSVMHANNEIGSVNPIRELVQLVKELCGAEVLFHTDAAQSIGKVPVDVSSLRVDFLSICSHKFYGPKGVGALYVREGVPLQNILFGAGHERGIRPGTENVMQVTGMAVALHIACNNLSENANRMQATRDELLRVIEEELVKVGMRYVANSDIRYSLPNTLNIALYKEDRAGHPRYISAQRLIYSVGNQVCMSAGSACHSSAQEVEVSTPLKSVGVDLPRAIGTLRLSTGRGTSVEEVRRAARIIVRHAAQQFGDV